MMGVTARGLGLCMATLLACGNEHAFEQPSMIRHSLNSHEAPTDSYIVAFREDVVGYSSQSPRYSPSYLRKMLSPYRVDTAVASMRSLVAVAMGAKPRLLEPDFPLSGPRPMDLNWQGPLHKPAFISRVDFVDEQQAIETLNRWSQQGRIWYAEPNYRNRLNSQRSSPRRASTGTDFSLASPLLTKHLEDLNDMIANNFELDWRWTEQIRLRQALEYISANDASHEPVIAVLDSGVDYEHPDLADRIFQNVEGINRIGCKDDLFGCNTTTSSIDSLGDGNSFPYFTEGPGQSCPFNEGFDQCSHGTLVAGLIAGQINQSAGSGGVCPLCKILPVKIVGDGNSNESGGILDSSIIAGLTYVSRFRLGGSNGVRVVNASFGKFQRSRTVELLVRLLKNLGNGTLVIAAAGNEDTMLRQFPAAFTDVLAVSNIEGDSYLKHPSSNFGRWVDISAPGGYSGDGMTSTAPGGGTYQSIGTSISSPVVAGVAGLILAAEPNLSFAELRNRLLNTATPEVYEYPENKPYNPTVEGEPRPVALLGSGIVDAFAAVSNATVSNQPYLKVSNRVTAGCGVIGGQRPASGFWLILGPLLVALYGFAGQRPKGRASTKICT